MPSLFVTLDIFWSITFFGKLENTPKSPTRNWHCCNVLCLSRRVRSRYRYSTLRPLMAFRGKNRWVRRECLELISRQCQGIVSVLFCRLIFIGTRSLFTQILPISQLIYAFFVDEKRATFLWLSSDASKKSKEEVSIICHYQFFYTRGILEKFRDVFFNRILSERHDKSLSQGLCTFLTDSQKTRWFADFNRPIRVLPEH